MHENVTFGTHRLTRSRPTRRQLRQRLPVLVGVVHSHLGRVCEDVPALLVVVVATGAVPEQNRTETEQKKEDVVIATHVPAPRQAVPQGVVVPTGTF